MSGARRSATKRMSGRTTTTATRKRRFVVDHHIGRSTAMRPTITPVPAGQYPTPAPNAAELPSVTPRHAEPIAWLVGQLNWEYRLDHLRDARDIRQRERSPTADVRPAIEPNLSAERAVLGPSHAGPADADTSSATGPATDLEAPTVIAAQRSRTKR